MIEESLQNLNYSIFPQIENIIRSSLSKELSYYRDFENWCHIFRKDKSKIPIGYALSFGTRESESFEVGVANYSRNSSTQESVCTKVFLMQFPMYMFKESSIAEVLEKFVKIDDMKELKKQIKYILE